MDEPFSALDELTSEVLRRELLQLWHSTRTTVVFVSHSVSEAVLLSDQVVVMTPAPGRIATVIDVTLERPRGDLVEVTDAFRDCEREVRLALRGALVPDQQSRDIPKDHHELRQEAARRTGGFACAARSHAAGAASAHLATCRGPQRLPDPDGRGDLGAARQ